MTTPETKLTQVTVVDIRAANVPWFAAIPAAIVVGMIVTAVCFGVFRVLHPL